MGVGTVGRTRVRLRVAVLACLVLGVLAACGQETSDESAPTASDETSPPASSSPSSSPSQPGDDVPGNPANEVRPATEAEQSGWPSCDDVWSVGSRIPRGYEGCVSGEDAVVADRIGCSFGGSMTTFDDRYYGVLGAVVNDAGGPLAESRPYARDYRLCRA